MREQFSQGQLYHQPLEHRENKIADIWRECGIHEMFTSFLDPYSQPFKSSFYVPRLGRSVLTRGGTVPA